MVKPGFLSNICSMNWPGSLKDAGQEAGIHFVQSPDLRVGADYSLSIDEFRIELPASDNLMNDTTYLSRTSHPKDPRKTKELIAPESYLIVNSEENIYLKQAVVNIGRSSSNQIIIDDPRVSRSHAQLRQIKGEYILFDLSSKGGTFVNGSKVSQCTLNSGDVISLAGVPIIYVHDIPADANKTQTMKIIPRLPSKPGNSGNPSDPEQKT